jgi:hypothetical protein
MKKLILSALVILFTFTLIGCGKKDPVISPVISLCDSVEKIADENINNAISYDEFVNKLNTQYSSSCSGETNDVCSQIKTIVDLYNDKSDDDCDEFSDPTYKKICEANKVSRQKVIDSKSEATFLKTLCSVEKDK